MGFEIEHFTDYLNSKYGRLKLLTVVIGLVSVSIGAHAFNDSLYNQAYRTLYDEAVDTPGNSDIVKNLPNLGMEKYFVGITTTFLVVSILAIILYGYSNNYSGGGMIRVVSWIYHVIGAILIFLAGILIIISATKINSSGCPYMNIFLGPTAAQKLRCHYSGEKITAGILSIFNAITYAVIAVITLIEMITTS